MKVLLLADPISSHTQKWANSLHNAGIEVAIFGLSNYNPRQYNKDIKIEIVDFSRSVKTTRDGNILKSVYLAVLPKLKKMLSRFKPDVLHAHSASSYGFLGALLNFHPYFISLWGSDVFLFPRKSFLHRKLFQYALNNADTVLSTSKAMKSEALKYIDREILVLPFGVDTTVFKPFQDEQSTNKRALVIGTVKTLDYNYGIDLLLTAFREVLNQFNKESFHLLIVGGGGMEGQLRNLSKELEINNYTTFTGFIEHEHIAKYHNMIDISVFPSVNESFGVSVLEASACERPVIVSDVGGLPETVENNVTGLIFPSRNINLLVEKIVQLIEDKNLRFKMGKAGRERVIAHFEWSDILNKMINIYGKVVLD